MTAEDDYSLRHGDQRQVMDGGTSVNEYKELKMTRIVDTISKVLGPNMTEWPLPIHTHTASRV